MKHSLILIIFLTWSISGCSFLGFHSDPYGLEDNEEVEESTAEGEAYDDEEEEWGEEESEEAEEEGEEKPGFFARLMSFGSDDEDEIEMEEEELEDGEGDQEEESEEQAAEQGDDQDYANYADMESYEEDSEINADMEGYEDYEEVEEERPSAVAATTSEAYYKKPSPPPAKTRKLVSVKKIKNAPYRKSGFLVNAVYLARSGDTIEAVSQKIYGQDRSTDLYSINPHFRSRSLKTGDKVYYPSPQRPNDSSQLLIYYEDIGLPPSYYTLERGRNIRSAAKNLLGSLDSWKEIWATNFEIQSKGTAERTVQLRYWDGSGASSLPPQPQKTAQMPEETFPEEPLQQQPEPPQNIAAVPIESPPPMEDFGDPLPPEDPASSQETGIMEMIQKNKLLAIGFIAFIALLLILFKRIIGKLKESGDEFDYTKTSIDNNKISI